MRAIAKTTVQQQTNFRLGKKNHKGKYSKSYVQQMVEVMLHRKTLNAGSGLAVFNWGGVVALDPLVALGVVCGSKGAKVLE